jgi:hypothetical protein
MSAGTPIRGSALRLFAERSRARAALFSLAAVIFASFLFATKAAAQDHWPIGSIAVLEGDDISVIGGNSPVPVAGATTLYVSSGGVVTVHAGLARLTLSTGSTVDVAGPAKFTVLESGGAFTLALNFGRLHLHLTGATPLRVYAPFVVAIPIAIADEPRDITVGLDLSDLMCVYAAQGAARLEPQFGGEAVLVPQNGELLLPAEKLPPVSAKPGSCRTGTYEPPAAAMPHSSPSSSGPAPASATNAPAGSSSSSSAPASASASASSQPAATNSTPAPASSASDKGFELPANANQSAPIVPPSAQSTPDPPPVPQQPIVKVIMPPLSFSASSPAPPRDNSPQFALVIPADAHVSREWIFSGHVEEASVRMRQAGEGDAAGSSTAQKKKHGFWSRMRQFFGGQAAPPPKPEGAFQN